MPRPIPNSEIALLKLAEPSSTIVAISLPNSYARTSEVQFVGAAAGVVLAAGISAGEALMSVAVVSPRPQDATKRPIANTNRFSFINVIVFLFSNNEPDFCKSNYSLSNAIGVVFSTAGKQN
jgi:hypothetical protein